MAVSIDIKSALKQLIERESDVSILQAIRTLLTKTSLDSVLKKNLQKELYNLKKILLPHDYWIKKA